MTDKSQELSNDELKQASGAGKYEVESQKVVSRGTLNRGVHGTDPGNVGNTDPISDERLDSINAGAGISAEQTAGRGAYGTGQVEPEPPTGETEPNPIWDTRRSQYIKP
jgi:hypothetical protein